MAQDVMHLWSNAVFLNFQRERLLWLFPCILSLDSSKCNRWHFLRLWCCTVMSFSGSGKEKSTFAFLAAKASVVWWRRNCSLGSYQNMVLGTIRHCCCLCSLEITSVLRVLSQPPARSFWKSCLSCSTHHRRSWSSKSHSIIALPVNPVVDTEVIVISSFI